MTLHLRNHPWRNAANLLLVPALTLGALTGCSDSTGSSGSESGEIRFIPAPFPDAVSPDGKTVLVRDISGPPGDVYAYDVATHKMSLVTSVGSSPLAVARGLSNTGVIVASYSDPGQAGVWSEAAGWQVLASPFPAGCDAVVGDAWSVSADGSVVAGHFFDGCRNEAFMSRGGVITILERIGTPLEGDSIPRSRATVVSNDGSTAAGYASLNGNDSWPAIWAADGSGFTLPSGGVFADDCPGEINALSADGSMAGGIWCQRAFTWTKAGSPVDLGKLPGNTDSDNASVNAIADNGNLLFGSSGNSWFGTPEQAFVWTAAKGMRPLAEALRGYLNFQNPKGYTLLNALHASADGTVVIGQAASPDGTIATYVVSVPISAYGL